MTVILIRMILIPSTSLLPVAKYSSWALRIFRGKPETEITALPFRESAHECPSRNASASAQQQQCGHLTAHLPSGRTMDNARSLPEQWTQVRAYLRCDQRRPVTSVREQQCSVSRQHESVTNTPLSLPLPVSSQYALSLCSASKFHG
jgi:hypothetical protein